MNYIMLWIRNAGTDDDQMVTGSHDWTKEVEQSVFEQLFDRLPQWLELPSQAECDWRDRALRDDPDVRRGPCSSGFAAD